MSRPPGHPFTSAVVVVAVAAAAGMLCLVGFLLLGGAR